MSSRARLIAPLLLASTAFAASACSSSSSDSTTADAASPDSPDAAPETPPKCGPGANVPPYVRGPAAEATFPAGFVFGAASAGMQIERGLVHADWYQWADRAGTVARGDKPDNGPDAFVHFDDDVKALVAAGAGAYRFSIEWARIFPTKAAFDANTPDAGALASYHDLLKRLRAAKIRPFVTLHHFATPDYLDDFSKKSEPQVFERPEMQAMFAEWARRMGKEFGAEVDDWITINEPLVLLAGAYLSRTHPPGLQFEVERMFRVAKMLVRTHAAAYDALKAADTIDAGTGRAAFISVAKHNRVFLPNDACNEKDVEAAKQTTYVWNQWMYNALVFGDWDDNLDGKLDGPKDKKADPTLKGRVDWLGLNYYGDTLVDSGLKLKFIGGVPKFEDLPTPFAKTDMGWDIYPHGLRDVLRELKPYKLPVYITENGVGDAADKNRSRYLAEHLWEVGRAVADDGVDVRGYLWWSLTDNFEWDKGFCPRFGLFKIDYASPDRTRTPTNAVALFKKIAGEGRIAATTIDALPAYSPGTRCPGP